MITIYRSANYQEIELFKTVLSEEKIESFVKGSELDSLRSLLPENDSLIELCVSEKDILPTLYLLKLPLTKELLEILQSSLKPENTVKKSPAESGQKDLNTGIAGKSIIILVLFSVSLVALLIAYLDVRSKYKALDMNLNSGLYVYSEYDNEDNCILYYHKNNDKLSSWVCYGEDGEPTISKGYDINGKIASQFFNDKPLEYYNRFITYDINGIKDSEGFDTDYDGRFDKFIYYDVSGREIRHEIDTDRNGRIENSEILRK
ncbi:hypothetical protein [Leptospira johnsonii]|uniref:EF-hand domain-containing protein n=1 Tax=Leptospira johnsonii TaxID=1917820 RepID=A0A2P2D7L8_9LEPT|nr:hypothetical protein [Leptospira johnsonii]GBF40623.1 hypothetical protein LPTSP1_36410 [Leptospira johnsonii]